MIPSLKFDNGLDFGSMRKMEPRPKVVRDAINRKWVIEKPQMFAGLVKPRANRMAHVLPQVLIDKWPDMVQKGVPFTLYGKWFTEAGGPDWYNKRNMIHCLLAYWETGDEQWLNDVTSGRFMMPDITQGQAVGHVSEVWHVYEWLLSEPYNSPELNAEWERRLKAWGEYIIDNVRIGDIDQCEIYAYYWKLLDKFLTIERDPFLGRTEVDPVIKWINAFYDPRDFRGGARDASSGYETGTSEFRLYAAAAYGKDIFPWFDEWATQYSQLREWLFNKDYTYAVTWGDTDGSNNNKVDNYHSPVVCYLLAGLGYNKEAMIAQARGVAKYKPELNVPGTLYPIGAAPFGMVCDPEDMLNSYVPPLKTGTYISPGIGITIYRDEDTLATAINSRIFREDGSEMETEDHHYTRPEAYYSVIYKNIPLIWQPHGYGIGGNQFYNFNATAMKNDDTFKCSIPSLRVTDSGFIAESKSVGPNVRYHHAIGDNFYPAENEFEGCARFNLIKFDKDTLTLEVQYKWESPGNTFDARSADLPIAQRCIHAMAPITQLDQSTLRWTIEGYDVTVSIISGAILAIDIEADARPLNGVQWWRAFVKCTPNDFNNGFTLLYNIHPTGTTPDTPAPPPTDVQRTQPTPDDQLPAPADLTIIDNSSLGFHVVGEWVHFGGQGIGGIVDYAEAGDGSRLSIWRAKVAPGIYNVATIWLAAENRAKDAPFKISLGGVVIQTTIVNQELPPNSFTDSDDIAWHTLADVTVNADSVLAVELSNAADEFVIADAVRIEKIGEVQPPVDPPVDPPPSTTDTPAKPFWRALEGGKRELVFPEP